MLIGAVPKGPNQTYMVNFDMAMKQKQDLTDMMKQTEI